MGGRQMKIAIIDMDNLKNPYWAAGQARATREVGKRLALRHNVTVYTSKYSGWKDYVEEGISYKHVGLNLNNPRLNNLLFIATIPFVVHKIKADVIIEEFNAPVSVSFSPLFTKTPVIGLPTMFKAGAFAQKYGLPFHWVEKIGFKFYKYLLPYSDVDSAKAKKLNPNIFYKIVPQGVGREFFKIKQAKPEYILYLGRFDIAQKGVDLLLRSFAQIHKKIGYPLVLAGHGPDEAQIRELIKDLKIENYVKIVGPAYGQKKFDLMSKALFVAFPSRHDEMCLWALEALAGGLPLVCFDVPESKWMSEKFSIKAKPFDTTEYAKALLRAVDPQNIYPMRKNARKITAKYTWEKVAQEFEDFFKQVLKKEKNEKN